MRYNRLSSVRLAALLVALVVALLIAQPLTVAAMPSPVKVCWQGTQCIGKGLCSKVKMCTFRMTAKDCRGEAIKTCHYE